MLTARDAHGFTLIEVLVAIALLVAIAVGMAQLAAIATGAMRASREQTSTVILAAAKMDQLRALTLSYEPIRIEPAIPMTDLATNVSHPTFARDGPGLRPSPSGTLAANVPPYVDYLDEAGTWVGNDSEPPPGAAFIRRWAIVPLPADPDRTLVLQVLVTTVHLDRSRSPGSWRQRTGPEALLVSVRTRRSL